MRKNLALQRASAPLRHVAAVRKRIFAFLAASALAFLGLWQPEMQSRQKVESIPAPRPVEEK
jgi:hypothetical protein